MIMAGGPCDSLSVLTDVRAAPALPFGGKFRLIDFSLSNCVNSDIFNVAVLTQYRPHSLNDHIGTGAPWDLDLIKGGLRVLQPYRGGPHGDWQRGTADAVRRNLDFVQMQNEEHALVLAGDHVYLMDYRPMLAQHERTGADLTVACRRVNHHETHRFGIISASSEGRIVDFEEKPRRTRENMASMGIYVFRKEVLFSLLDNDDMIDFGKDVLPAMVENGHDVRSYTFPGYWADVGTVQAYWEANMSLLAEDPALDLYDTQWVIHTRSMERAPVRVGASAKVDGNLLSNGCRVDGVVERSILSPGVHVSEGASVVNSIILHDTVIEPGAVVDSCIVDKNCVIGSEAQVGTGDDNSPNKLMPSELNTGLTLVGRDSQVPAKLQVGRNVTIHAGSGSDVFKRRKKIKSGDTVGVS